jgi:hypothetical protein
VTENSFDKYTNLPSDIKCCVVASDKKSVKGKAFLLQALGVPGG